MHTRTNLHAGANSAKGLNCAQKLAALNQQINVVESVLSQCSPKKPIVVNPPNKDGWWMWGPNGQVYQSDYYWDGSTWSYYTPPSAGGYSYGVGGGAIPPASGAAPTGGYVAGLFYPDRSGTCG